MKDELREVLEILDNQYQSLSENIKRDLPISFVRAMGALVKVAAHPPQSEPQGLRDDVAAQMFYEDSEYCGGKWEAESESVKEHWREKADRVIPIIRAAAPADVGLRAACEALLAYEESMDGAEQGDGRDDLYWKAVKLARAALSSVPAQPSAPADGGLRDRIRQITHPDEGPCPVCSHVFDAHIEGCPYEAIDAALSALPATPTLVQVLAWLKGRPGISWVATIQDIEEAVKDLSGSPRLPKGRRR